ncbi:MAG TPA: biotin--[acetyl-CoA-carboxylase] ligase [Stellaceae bacterium]|nr:biotin--[acetyl-CoA-carboxylase] ligase [Stellaceae bacterium]
MTAQPRLSPFYRVQLFDAIDSTNEEGKRQARNGAAEGTLIWARAQTAGRGRRGRDWVSPEGNLYLSLVLRPERSAAEAAQLGFAAALAVAEAVGPLLPEGVRLSLKWPNDVLLDGRKVSGILLESQASDGRLDWLIVGMGINLASFPERGDYPATSLVAVGASVAVEALLAAVAARFEAWYRRWREAGFAPLREAWLARAQGLGATIRVRLSIGESHGRFAGLDAEGALLLDDDVNGLRRVAAGEVFPVTGAVS